MKVSSTTLPPTSGDLANPTAAGRGRKASTAASAAASTAGQAPEKEKPATAKSAEAQGPKALPPGLEKVQARLQEIAAGERTRGQERALNAISANIARYREQQAIATPPAEIPLAPPGETPAATGTPVTAEAAAVTEAPAASVDTTA